MDPFTIKPIDKEAIISNAKECGGRVLTVEDHYPEVNAFNCITLMNLSLKIKFIFVREELEKLFWMLFQRAAIW